MPARDSTARPTALQQASPQTRQPGRTTGSQTVTQTPPQQPFPIHVPPSGTLRLRADETPAQAGPAPAQQGEQRHVQWAEGVVNNEGMGKKSSKVCCIYHKPRVQGESSDEDSSSSESDSDEGGGDGDDDDDDGAARMSGGRNGCGHSHGHGRRRRNAYEKQPGYTPLGKKQAEERAK